MIFGVQKYYFFRIILVSLVHLVYHLATFQFFRGIPTDTIYRSVCVPRFAVWRFFSPDCTHFVRLSGVIESAFLWNAGEYVAVPMNRRLANEGVKKSGEVSVKNGELSEDERNEMKLIKFFAV